MGRKCSVKGGLRGFSQSDIFRAEFAGVAQALA